MNPFGRDAANGILECHPHHQRYKNDKPSHEAGYDSYMTARIVTRLSAKLEALGYYVESENQEGYREYFDSPSPRHKLRRFPSSKASESLMELIQDEDVLQSERATNRQDGRIKRGTFVDRKPSLPGLPVTLNIPSLMPHFENDFWRIYGNKLRVNGTVEEVLDLAD